MKANKWTLGLAAVGVLGGPVAVATVTPSRGSSESIIHEAIAFAQYALWIIAVVVDVVVVLRPVRRPFIIGLNVLRALRIRISG